MVINYSIIIPHKNTPDLLQKCIDSIPHRDDVQIIVVDDNSDEDKVDFANFPDLHDERVEVYLTKEGKGAGYARNIGLSHAHGKWIVFADADDFFNPCFNEALDEFAGKDNDYEVVFFKGNAIKLADGSLSTRGDSFNEVVDDAIKTSNFSKALTQSTPCRKFFNKNFLQEHNITFNEVRWSNDVVFSAKVALYATRLYASAMPIYCVTESEGSLTKNVSLACRIVRFEEECEEVKILGNKFPESDLKFWLFVTWFNVYKTNKLVGIKMLPKAILHGRARFIELMFKQYLQKLK